MKFEVSKPPNSLITPSRLLMTLFLNWQVAINTPAKYPPQIHAIIPLQPPQQI